LSQLPDSSQINELLIMSKDTGQCLYVARSNAASSLDEAIFSAFISAVYTFSLELGSGGTLERMVVGDKELFIITYSEFIFVLDTVEDVKSEYLVELLEKVSQEFLSTVNKHDLEPQKITFQTDLSVTGFEKRLLELVQEIGSKYLALTPGEKSQIVEKQLVSILGNSLGNHVITEVRKTTCIRIVENEDDLSKYLENLELSLTTRLNRVQAKQLMKKIKKAL